MEPEFVHKKKNLTFEAMNVIRYAFYETFNGAYYVLYYRDLNNYSLVFKTHCKFIHIYISISY